MAAEHELRKQLRPHVQALQQSAIETSRIFVQLTTDDIVNRAARFTQLRGSLGQALDAAAEANRLLREESEAPLVEPEP